MHEPLGLLGTAVTGALTKAKGCPLCHLKDEAGLRYVRWILHEYINDAAFRARLIDSMGFCGRHWRIMIDQRDNLGNAILLEATASQALGALRRALERVDVRMTRRGSTPRSEMILPEVTNIKACPACETEASSDDGHVWAASQMLAEGRIRAEDLGARICIKHSILMLDHLPPESARQLLESKANHLELLRKGCEEVIRSCDHLYQGDKPDMSALTETVATVNVQDGTH